MTKKEKIAIRLLLFAVRMMIGYNWSTEYKDAMDKIQLDLIEKEPEKT